MPNEIGPTLVTRFLGNEWCNIGEKNLFKFSFWNTNKREKETETTTTTKTIAKLFSVCKHKKPTGKHF